MRAFLIGILFLQTLAGSTARAETVRDRIHQCLAGHIDRMVNACMQNLMAEEEAKFVRVAKNFDEVDKKTKQYLELLTKPMSAEMRENYLKAQEDWEDFREKECAFSEKLNDRGKDEQFWHPTVRTRCLLKLTSDRITLFMIKRRLGGPISVVTDACRKLEGAEYENCRKKRDQAMEQKLNRNYSELQERLRQAEARDSEHYGGSVEILRELELAWIKARDADARAFSDGGRDLRAESAHIADENELRSMRYLSSWEY